jgi:hypothetical protein
MTPLGTKAIIFTDSDTRASWAPHGLDAWLLGPSKDHYHCHLYYVPKTKGYRVSGLAELFPQHCIAPPYSHETHVNKLVAEIKTTIPQLSCCARTLSLMQSLAKHLDAYISGTPIPLIVPKVTHGPDEQRVTTMPDVLHRLDEQRVTPTPVANAPTSRQAAKEHTRTNQRQTRTNTPGILPAIIRAPITRPLPLFTEIEPEMPLTFNA